MDARKICLYGLLVMALALLALLASGGNQGARAQDGTGLAPNIVGIDVNPAENTATSLGTADRCIEVGGVGSTFDIDVFLNDVPLSSGSYHNLGGFEFRLIYDNARLRVNSTDHNFLITSFAGQGLMDAGDCSPAGSPCPDTDGVLSTGVVGLGGEAGAELPGSLGVLSRLTLEVLGGEGTLNHLTLTELNLAGYEPGFTPWPDEIDQVWDGIIAIDTPCPTPVDVEIVGQSMLVDLPPTIDVDTDYDVTLRKTIRNNGPTGPVDVDITTDVTAPADCTATPEPSNPTSHIGLTSAPVIVDEVYTINCTQAGSHGFTFDNEVQPSTPDAFDPSLANNTASTQTNTDVLAEADLNVSEAVTVEAPSSGASSFPVTVNALVTNNGPYSPVSASVTLDLDLTGAPHCTRVPDNSQVGALPALGSDTASAVWTITCTTEGIKIFSGSADVVLSDPHVSDPALDNNSDTGAWDARNVIVQDLAGANHNMFFRRQAHRISASGGLYAMWYDWQVVQTDTLRWKKASTDPAISWSDAGSASPGLPGGITAQLTHIASVLDSDGVIHIAGLDTTQDDTVLYIAFDTDDDTWGSWEEVHDQDISGSAWSTLGVDIAVDDNDRPHIVWGTDNGKVRYAEKTGSDWSTPADLYSAGNDNRWPSIIIDGGGTIHVAWIHETLDGGDKVVDVLYRKNTGSWQSTETVIEDISAAECDGRSWHPQLKVNSQDQPWIAVAACYEHVSEIDHFKPKLLYKSNGSWQQEALPDSYDGWGFAYTARHLPYDMAIYYDQPFLIWADTEHSGVIAHKDHEGAWIWPCVEVPSWAEDLRLGRPQWIWGVDEPTVDRLEYVFWWEGEGPTDDLAYTSGPRIITITDSGSTPEVCDGVDNDGDGAVDEGFPDTNNDGEADCHDDDFDADGDGIGNATDPNDDDYPSADPFSDAEENYIGTDKEVTCSVSGGSDNDPLDMNADGKASIADIMWYFAFGEYGSDKADDDQLYRRRLDLNADERLNIVDIMEYTADGAFGKDCPYGP